MTSPTRTTSGAPPSSWNGPAGSSPGWPRSWRRTSSSTTSPSPPSERAAPGRLGCPGARARRRGVAARPRGRAAGRPARLGRAARAPPPDGHRHRRRLRRGAGRPPGPGRRPAGARAGLRRQRRARGLPRHGLDRHRGPDHRAGRARPVGRPVGGARAGGQRPRRQPGGAADGGPAAALGGAGRRLVRLWCARGRRARGADGDVTDVARGTGWGARGGRGGGGDRAGGGAAAPAAGRGGAGGQPHRRAGRPRRRLRRRGGGAAGRDDAGGWSPRWRSGGWTPPDGSAEERSGGVLRSRIRRVPRRTAAPCSPGRRGCPGPCRWRRR